MKVQMLIITALIISSFITLALALYALKKLRSNGSTAYILLMLSICIYSFGYAFELYNSTVEGIFLALKIEYLGIVALPVFWVILAIKYTGHGKKLTPFIYFLITIIPAITIVLVFTNNYHHLYYSRLEINNGGPFPLIAITKGIWYYITFVYNNIMILGGTVLFGFMMLRTTGTFRKQASIMFFSSLIPWVGYVLYLMDLSPYGIDFSPFFLTITGPLFALALFRYGMFDITPIARDTVFEEMSDPVIVLDNSYRIADYNKSVLTTYPQFSNDVIGTVIDELITENRVLIDQIHSRNSDAVEVVIENENGSVYYHSSITELYSSAKKKIGKIITFHDISVQKKMQRELHNLATIDKLTKLYNRRYFIKVSKNELKRARRYKRPVSFLLIDLDHFKKVNDIYGHQAGDEVLIHAAKIFAETLRDNDVVARYGDEEFTALLPEIDEAGAFQTAERLRTNLDALIITFKGSKIHITASIGISTCLSERYAMTDKNDILLEKLLSEADKALYIAKNNGRNRVVAYNYSSKEPLS